MGCPYSCAISQQISATKGKESNLQKEIMTRVVFSQNVGICGMTKG